MPDRKKSIAGRTLSQFIGRGLYPCNGCILAALRLNGEPLFSRRVYLGGVEDAYTLAKGACPSCGFFVWSNGKISAEADLMREVCRRETKEDCGRPDASAHASPQVPEGGRLGMRPGNKQVAFSTGATRDAAEGKGRPSLISPILIYRLGVLLAEGAIPHGDDNWIKGMPYRRTADSIIRHIEQWLASDKGEDHLAAIAFGVMCLMTYEAQSRTDLDDRCPELKDILDSFLTSSSSEPTIEGAASVLIADGKIEELFVDNKYKHTGVRYGT